MQNAGLDEAQAGLKISGRNINNLRYADDTTFMAESEEELKGLFMNVKEESWKIWLITQHSQSKDYGSGTITSWQLDVEKWKTVIAFIYLVPKLLQMVTQPWI